MSKNSKPRTPKGMPAGTIPGELQEVSGGPEEVARQVSAQTSNERAALEALRGHPLIAYYIADHAQLGDEQMQHLYEHLRLMGGAKKISLFLYSRGGSTVIPAKVVPLIREYCDEFAVLVPYRAQSSATMIALGADEIVMTEMSELGPVDPSHLHPLLPRVKKPDGEEVTIRVSVQDLRHVLSFIEREIGRDEMTPDAAATVYTALFEKVHPLAIGGLEQSYELAHHVSELVLGTHMDTDEQGDEIKRIAKQLGEGYKDHTFPIGRREARKVGLKVVDATSDEADAMWSLYLKYSSIGLNGEGTIRSEKATMIGLGFIESEKGSSIGTQLTSIKNPTNQMVGWHSVWV